MEYTLFPSYTFTTEPQELLGPIVNTLLLQESWIGEVPDPKQLTPSQLRSLFGNRLNDVTIDRFSPRLERTFKLAENEFGSFWENTTRIHDWFSEAWQAYQNK